MTGNELVLFVLSDLKPHTVEEIEVQARLRAASRITVHSRVADLRKQGYAIDSFRSKEHGPGYWMKELLPVEGRVRVREFEPNAVQGYVFQSIAEHPRNGDVCQILNRAGTDVEQLDRGPGFNIRFGDSEEMLAYSDELSPWYPT